MSTEKFFDKNTNIYIYINDHSSLHIPRAFSCKQGLGRILCAQHSLSERFEVRTALVHTKGFEQLLKWFKLQLCWCGNLRAASGKLLKHTTPLAAVGVAGGSVLSLHATCGHSTMTTVHCISLAPFLANRDSGGSCALNIR